MMDGPIKQGDHLLMARAGAIIVPYEALPGGHECDPFEEWPCGRNLSRQEPGQPPFCSVGHIKVAAPGCQWQRGDDTEALVNLEAPLYPPVLGENATASILQDVEIAKRCLVRIVEGHVSPLRSHGLSEVIGLAGRPVITK
jgi:hypothetical protein